MWARGSATAGSCLARRRKGAFWDVAQHAEEEIERERENFHDFVSLPLQKMPRWEQCQFVGDVLRCFDVVDYYIWYGWKGVEDKYAWLSRLNHLEHNNKPESLDPKPNPWK